MRYAVVHDPAGGFEALLPDGTVIRQLDGSGFKSVEQCEGAMRALERFRTVTCYYCGKRQVPEDNECEGCGASLRKIKGTK